MRRTVIMLALVPGLGAAACEPRSGVDLVEVGGAVQVVFFNCKHPAQLLPVKEVGVRRVSAGENAAPECRLRVKDRASIVGSWRYGEPVEGYEMSGCGPLQPGETYQVDASMGPVGAHAVVTLEASGKLTTRSGGCD